MEAYRKYILLILMFAAAVGVPSVNGSSPDTSDSSSTENTVKPLFDFFKSDELLEVTLQFNLREFIRTRLEPDRKFDARLTVYNKDDNRVLSQDIRLNARGKMRRKYCSFPPIMLKVRKGGNQEQVFAKGNYKLVTHCSIGGNFDNYILKEYLAYKLYNLVTPYSFKTRLVMVNYVDSINPKRTFREYGILIEDVDDMAARNNAILIENLKVNQHHMDDIEMARVAFFNYMIGNTDWSVAEQHNTKILKINIPSAQKGIPVTYDFDYSGFVNTSYACPNEKIPITHVTERYFLGGCYSDELFRQIIDEFEELHPQIIKTIEDFPYLPRVHKKFALTYLNNFYKKYKKENSLIAEIGKTCHRIN